MVRETEIFQNYVVSLENEEGEIFGCGLLLQQDLVVTCSHVVRDINNFSRSSELLVGESFVYVSRPFQHRYKNNRYKAYLEINRPDTAKAIPKDIAILRISPPPKWRFRSPQLITNTDVRGHHVVAEGFPEDSTTSTESTYEVGGERAEDQWLHSNALSGQGHEIRGGYSGSPVWDLQLNGFIGLLTEAEEARRVAYIIPMHHVAMLEESIDGLQDFKIEKDSKNLTPPGLIRNVLDNYFPVLHGLLTRSGIFKFPTEYDDLESYTEKTYAQVYESLARRTLIGLKAKTFEYEIQPSQRQHTFYSPIQQFVREIEGHRDLGGESSATILMLSRKSKLVKNLVARILHAREPLILLGEPGSGKSLTLDQARLNIADRNRKRIFQHIAIYAPLGEFYSASHNVTDQDVSEFVYRCADEKIRPYLRDLRKHGRLIIFLDGMDEMSRQRYNEHVEAISLYARAGSGKAKTIVACRTADFSPRFQHRRLVILPFTPAQIKEYLKHQFPENAIDIEGQHWTHKKLALRLSKEVLSIDARVPYVLWMFSLFIRDRKRWPQSRVELLHHCYAQKLRDYYARDHSTIDDVKIDEIFSGWGRIAYEIAQANQGTAIPLASLSNIVGVNDFIALGRGCGALEQSLDKENELLKFEHHRAEEFFIAYFLELQSDELDWESLLDFPRWRETLVNLLLLGVMRKSTSTVSASGLSAVENFLEDAADWNSGWAKNERLLAERVEFAGRMQRDFNQGENFQKKLSAAVYNLAKNGNPITRIKMFEVARRTSGVDVQVTVEPSLESEIDYLRTQAMLVASAADQEASREYLPSQLFFAFANGTLIKRAKEFLTIGKQIKQWKPASLIAVVFICFILQMIFQLTVVDGLAAATSEQAGNQSAKIAQSLLDNEDEESSEGGLLIVKKLEEYKDNKFLEITGQFPLGKRLADASKQLVKKEKEENKQEEKLKSERKQVAWNQIADMFQNYWFLVLIYTLSIIGWIFAVFRLPDMAMISALASGMVAMLTAIAVIFVANDLDDVAFSILFGFATMAYIFKGGWLFLSRLVIVVPWILIAHMVAWVMNLNLHFRRYSEVLFGEIDENEVDVYRLSLIAIFVFLPIMPIALLLVDYACIWVPQSMIEYMMENPSLGLQIRNLLVVVPCMILVVHRNQSFREEKGVALIVSMVFFPLILLITTFIIYVIEWIKDSTVVATTFAWLFRIGFLGLLIAFVGFVLWRVMLFLGSRRIQIVRKGSLDERLHRAKNDPAHQSLILKSVSFKELGLEPEDFLDCLVNVEYLIKTEPALSTYWRKRYETEEVVQQGRE